MKSHIIRERWNAHFRRFDEYFLIFLREVCPKYFGGLKFDVFLPLKNLSKWILTQLSRLHVKKDNKHA